MFNVFFAVIFMSLAAFAGPADAAAKKSLNNLLQAYAQGNIAEAEGLIDPVMLGYQQLVDAMRSSVSSQKQIKIHLKEAKFTTAKDIVVIRTSWEKRYLSNVVSGKTLFLMQLIRKEWTLSSQSGDNIFAM